MLASLSHRHRRRTPLPVQHDFPCRHYPILSTKQINNILILNIKWFTKQSESKIGRWQRERGSGYTHYRYRFRRVLVYSNTSYTTMSMPPETDQQASQVQSKSQLTLPCGLARVEGSLTNEMGMNACNIMIIKGSTVEPVLTHTFRWTSKSMRYYRLWVFRNSSKKL